MNVLSNTNEKEDLKETVIRNKENGSTKVTVKVEHVSAESVLEVLPKRKKSVSKERIAEEMNVGVAVEMPQKSPPTDSQTVKTSATPVEGIPKAEVKLSQAHSGGNLERQQCEEELERQSGGNISVSVLPGEPSTPASQARPTNSQQTENNILEETKDNIPDIQQHQMEDNVKIDAETKSVNQTESEEIHLKSGGEPSSTSDLIKDNEIKSGTDSSPPSSEEGFVLSIDDHVKTVDLPDQIDDTEFNDKLKVFNNYRNFGAMYFAKNNFKKAEWAFKNGIKQSTSGKAKSKDQLRKFLGTEVEFRLSRARYVVCCCCCCVGIVVISSRCCQSLLLPQEAVKECKAILKIESNQEALDLLKIL